MSFERDARVGPQQARIAAAALAAIAASQIALVAQVQRPTVRLRLCERKRHMDAANELSWEPTASVATASAASQMRPGAFSVQASATMKLQRLDEHIARRLSLAEDHSGADKGRWWLAARHVVWWQRALVLAALWSCIEVRLCEHLDSLSQCI